MALDIGAAFKITAGVAGQPALDALNKSVGSIGTGIGKLPGLAKTAGLALAGIVSGLAFSAIKEKFDGVVESILLVDDAAQRTGSSIEKIGGLVQVAKAVGEDWAGVEAGVTRLNKALAGTDDESKGAARALAAIGVSVSELRSMDPADAFLRVSQAMADTEDSAGKSAVAMDIFGKSGAALIPFMHDYAELGAQVGKVTQQQVQDADAYQRATIQLNIAQQALFKTLAVELLPVAADFAKTLVDVLNNTNGVKGAAQSLAADGSLKGVFREGARAAAALLDVIALVIKGVAQIGESFGVVWNDLKTLGKIIGGGVAGAFTEEGRAYVAQAIKDRDAYMAKVGAEFDKRWAGGPTPFADALEQRFADRDRAGTGAGAGRGNVNPGGAGGDSKRSVTGYTSRAPTPPSGGSKADPFGDQLDSLGQEAAKLKEQIAGWEKYGEAVESARGAAARYQVEQGKFKALSQGQKDALVAQADEVDRLAQKLKDLKTAAEFEKQTQQIEANTRALGLNTQERELAVAGQELENKGIKEGSELYQKLMASRQAALQNQAAANADPLLGLKQGINEVGEQAMNVAGNVKTVFVNAFNNASNALTDFVMTGKLDFKSFAKSVISDLTNMIIKQMMFNALKSALGGTGIGAALGFAKGGAFDGGVHAFAAGGVVSSPTLFKFASGGVQRTGLMGEAGPEAIMPLRRGADGRLGVVAAGAGQGGGVTIGSINVQTDGTTSANDASGKNGAALGRQLSAAIQAEILKQQRPGGLLAAA